MAVPARVGRYEIELVLGQGAVGRVFLARDPELGRQVAIKVLRDDLGLPAQALAALAAQWRKAARATAALSHPGVASLHDVGEQAGVGVYAVSELVKGLTLRERIARGRLFRGELAVLARALGSALAFAHAEGTIHGNFKPENVLLSANGPKIVDFGFPGWLLRETEQGSESASKAEGPQADCAPEVLASGMPSARGDQYSLAASLYEALTGRSVAGSTSATAASSPMAAGMPPRLRAPSGLLPELGGAAHLDAIFDCALAADPRRRFPTCEVFGTTLADALELASGTLPTPPTSQSSIVPRATRRWQNAVGAAAVLVIFALVGLGGRHQGATEGISLKSVARAFSATFAAPRGASIGAWPSPSLSPSLPLSPAADRARPVSSAVTLVSPSVASLGTAHSAPSASAAASTTTPSLAASSSDGGGP
jgi:serine/threonine-protein kinase